jgi:hypothetical protein
MAPGARIKTTEQNSPFGITNAKPNRCRVCTILGIDVARADRGRESDLVQACKLFLARSMQQKWRGWPSGHLVQIEFLEHTSYDCVQ